MKQLSNILRRISSDIYSFWPSRGKSEEEQLARAIMRIIKQKSQAQGVDPKAVIDQLVYMKKD